MAQPELAAPPRHVQALLAELAAARWTAQRWHHGGRYGVAVRQLSAPSAGSEGVAGSCGDGCTSAARGIPITRQAAATIAGWASAGEDGGAAAAALPTLRALVASGEATLHPHPTRGAPAPLRTKQQRPCDHTVHPERADVPAPPNPPPFTFIELFAGIGGFRLGLEALGGRCLFASEIDPDAVAVYRANFPRAAVVGDITAVPDAQIPAHDVLTAGFPCQPFSSLGEQPGLDDEKGTLFRQIVRVLELRRPAAFLLENVPGLLKVDGGAAFATIVAALRGAGYRVWWEQLNARCLSAQNRNRLYFVGLRRDAHRAAGVGPEPEPEPEPEPQPRTPPEPEGGPAFLFPYIPDLQLRAADILQPKPEPEPEPGPGPGPGPEPEPPQPEDGDTPGDPIAEGWTGLTDEQWARFVETTVWRRRGASSLAWGDSVCRAVISHYGQDVAGNGGVTQLVPRHPPHNPRTFSPREAARLQGFPDGFALSTVAGGEAGGEGLSAARARHWHKVLYRLIGNAVCAPVIAALGGAILAQLRHEALTGAGQRLDEGTAGVAAGEAGLHTAAEGAGGSGGTGGGSGEAGEAGAGSVDAAVGLALRAVAPHRRAAVAQRWADTQAALKVT